MVEITNPFVSGQKTHFIDNPKLIIGPQFIVDTENRFIVGLKIHSHFIVDLKVRHRFIVRLKTLFFIDSTTTSHNYSHLSLHVHNLKNLTL